MQSLSLSESEWLGSLAASQSYVGKLLRQPEAEQINRGYFHTLKEICQQPATLVATGEQMAKQGPRLSELLSATRAIVLTGSGSSEYAGDCVRWLLQNELGILVESIPAGTLITHGRNAIPPVRPALVVSLARSGDSPESVGVVSLLLEREPELPHLVLTCNSQGGLASKFLEDRRVHVIALDDRTNDRSLVMTSSFTSLALAARFLGLHDKPEEYVKLSAHIAVLVRNLLHQHFDTFHRVGKAEFRRAVFLGCGSRFGAAREASLKMLEMTAGRVATMCETFLGFRHGPMSYLQPDSLIVCFLSSDPMLRAYESDLLRELNRKNLGMMKIVIGESIPADVLSKSDVAVECAGLRDVGDENACTVHVVAGQMLAFFRCLEEGLRPDSPSEAGIINRVVDTFELHLPNFHRT
jgi:tagatose-6-phosphate ketose/aldose isomerase